MRSQFVLKGLAAVGTCDYREVAFTRVEFPQLISPVPRGFFPRAQSLRDTNLYWNTWWEKSKNVEFCNILNTLQLFINIVVLFISQVVPESN